MSLTLADHPIPNLKRRSHGLEIEGALNSLNCIHCRPRYAKQAAEGPCESFDRHATVLLHQEISDIANLFKRYFIERTFRFR